MPLTSFAKPIRAAVIGATGGIGQALATALAADPAVAALVATSRRTPPAGDGRIQSLHLDLEDEASIEAAAGAVRERLRGLDLIVIATGILHAPGIAPEKSYRQLDPAAMARVLALNTIGPALVAKHFLPLLPREGRCIMAALSARVGSIGDNALGGWHSYRASKAALNMLIRNLAIEEARRNERSIVVGLHPGTVATGLSAPFRGGVPAGRLFTPDHAAFRLLATLDGLGPEDTGGVFAHDGTRLPD